MTRKTLKYLLLASLAAVLALTATAVFAGTSTKDQLPAYVGSKACLGCHADKLTTWDDSGHAHMVDAITKASDLPGDPAKAPADLKAELDKAAYIVAGQRFVARDPKTGNLTFLNVQWDAAQKQYVAYKGGTDWSKNCAGCHSTGYDKATSTFAETGIGCEMCHGPGRDHILGKGDISKITVTNANEVCGQCHTGGKAPDGTAWAVGYRPGMDLSKYMNIPKVDASAPGFPGAAAHLRQYAFVQASVHANSVKDLQASGHASDRCYECHAQAAYTEKLAGETGFTAKGQTNIDAITCTTCHDPHGSTNQAQLRTDPQTLCTSCHTAELPAGGSLKPGDTAHHPMKEMQAGYGAAGISNVQGPHSKLECVDCHMTEGNHLMKVLTPEDVIAAGDATRKDTCTTCHTNSSAESRAMYLDMWRETVTSKVAALNADIAIVDAALKANANALTGDKLTAYKAAKTNISFVVADGSGGAHNFDYVSKILAQAQKDVAAAKAAVGK